MEAHTERGAMRSYQSGMLSPLHNRLTNCSGESPRPIVDFVGMRNKRLCLTTKMLCCVFLQYNLTYLSRDGYSTRALEPFFPLPPFHLAFGPQEKSGFL